MPQFLKQERVKKSTISLHVFHTCKNSLHVFRSVNIGVYFVGFDVGF